MSPCKPTPQARANRRGQKYRPIDHNAHGKCSPARARRKTSRHITPLVKAKHRAQQAPHVNLHGPMSYLALSCSLVDSRSSYSRRISFILALSSTVVVVRPHLPRHVDALGLGAPDELHVAARRRRRRHRCDDAVVDLQHRLVPAPPLTGISGTRGRRCWLTGCDSTRVSRYAPPNLPRPQPSIVQSGER